MAKKKEERAILDFDQKAYDYALAGLEAFRREAEYLRSAFQLQELLSAANYPFTTKTYQEILQGGNQYIADKVEEAVINTFERMGAGMRSQYRYHKIFVDESYGRDKMDRITDSMKSAPPGTRSEYINPLMIEFQDGKAVIPEAVTAGLKTQFCVFDDDKLAVEVFELLNVTTATLNAIQTMIDRASHEAEMASGLKLNRNIQLFRSKKDSVVDGIIDHDRRGVFWIDNGTWKFNIKPFKKF